MMPASQLSDAVSLQYLLDGLIAAELVGQVDQAADITNLTVDSRSVTQGSLFIAYRGEQVDRGCYIEQAIRSGAVAVLVEEDFRPARVYPIPVLPITGLRGQVGAIASRFYGAPSAKQKVVGVTGTNGKSTIAWQLSHALTSAGHPSAMIGTLGYGLPGQLQEASLTTPDAITLQSLLASWQGRVYGTVMEVSSHALAQSRVAGVQFDIAVQTNLSRDHLDYHGDMSAYAEAKLRLLKMPGIAHAVLNLDDEHGRIWLQDLADLPLRLCAYTRSHEHFLRYQEQCPVVYGELQSSIIPGLQMSLTTPWGSGELRTFCIGGFNAENLLASLAVLCLLDIPLNRAISLLEAVPAVPGRMEPFARVGQALLVVDYAHTPTALSSALQALRPLTRARLHCVFGCGGERDRGKRKQMGRIAEQLSDHVIITSDNPRREVPGQIISDILSGLQGRLSVQVLQDREQAIRTALEQAGADDIVLIAGRGHETRQWFGEQQVPCSDRALAGALCGRADG